jgi:phospholipase C
MPSPDPVGDMLDTFDHVVVLMLENRSFDNLLGYMYPNGVPASAPLGKTFEGVTGKSLSNPVPSGVKYPPPHGATTIAVSPVEDGNWFQPYPDPGENYSHVNTQLFNVISAPYNLPSPLPPADSQMQGFVKDYIENFKNEYSPNKFPDGDPNPKYDPPASDFPWTGYKQIMQSYPTSAVSAVTTLAREFAVFDHWFCAVPSETWCNRAFWNAGTSWGFVINPPESGDRSKLRWLIDSNGPTMFNQIEEAGPDFSWKIYTPNIVPATAIIHLGALVDFLPFKFEFFKLVANPNNRMFTFGDFLSNCRAGTLPSYAFLEPRFFTPQNDMHPSTPNAWADGSGKGDVGPVLLGDALVRQVYEAIRTSPQRDRTLLIITFDEHGGCYDHVPPPGQVTPPDMTGCTLEDGFDFTRLGVRIPVIMVSSHIARNTVVNTPKHHGSFMSTLCNKWQFPPLTARVADAPDFSEVFTSATARPIGDWPVLSVPVIPEEFWTRDFSQVPLSEFQRSIVEGASLLPHAREAKKRGLVPLDVTDVKTNGEALNYLRSIPGLVPEEPLSTFK